MISRVRNSLESDSFERDTKDNIELARSARKVGFMSGIELLSKGRKNGEVLYEIHGVTESLDGTAPSVTIGVVGTGAVYKEPIDKLYDSDFVEYFSNKDILNISGVYFAFKQNKLHLIKSLDLKKPLYSGWLLLLVGVYLVIITFSNLFASKITSIFGIEFTATNAVFPIAFISLDIITEVYGYQISKKIIWIGIFANFLVMISSYIVLGLPAAPVWKGQYVYQQVLASTPRYYFASLLAYGAEFINSATLAKLKVLTRGKKFWMRMFGSSIVSNFSDSLIFCLVAYLGEMPIRDFIGVILAESLIKTGYETLFIPITKKITDFLKKSDGIDVYDHNTKLNPFVLG